SKGEQNILALIYFFKTLNQNKKIGELNNESIFIVLDDPVSSLDENNVVGILYYIKYEIDLIRKNPKNKILILTHRWYVYDSIKKFYDRELLHFELSRENGVTSQRFISSNNGVRGYKELLNDVYLFSK